MNFLESLTGHQLAYFAILVAALALLLTERLRNDVVGMLIVLTLALTGVLKPEQALAGFASEPAIVLATIFVLSGALHQTGLSETIGVWIGRAAGESLTRAIAVIMPAVALMSAFTHHVTTTAVMLPVMLDLSRDRGIPASKLLMPLSFAASLGTTITIIGAPAFLVASGVLQQAGRPGLGIFSIAPIGLALSAAGTLFMLLAGRFLLPERQGSEDTANRFRLDQYFTELTIRADSPFLGKRVNEIEVDGRYRFDVVGWLRNGRRLRGSGRERQLEAGDVLLIRTTPDQMVAFREEKGVELHPVEQYGDQASPGPNGDEKDIAERLAQAVVAPNSEMVGRTIGDVDFRRRYGAIVIAVWRQDGWPKEELARVKLQAGDVLVLQGDDESLGRVQSDPAFLMIVPFHGEARLRRKAPLAGAIMLGTVVAAALGLPLHIAGLAGAVTIVLTRCLTARQAYRSIDQRIFVFIAGAIPLGTAMEKSGADKLLAGSIQHGVGGWNQFVILLVVFAIVAMLTQLMSDAATTAVFGPVAAALAAGLGHPPEPYVVTVAMAAVASFLSPIGHHGNLLIYGPGGYRFADFVRVGAPLTVIVAVVVVAVAPLLWRS
jgi:di/tricarboxylate transporter